MLLGKLCVARLELCNLYYTLLSICNAARETTPKHNCLSVWKGELEKLLFPCGVACTPEACPACFEGDSLGSGAVAAPHPTVLLLRHLQRVTGDASDGSLFLAWFQWELQQLSACRTGPSKSGSAPIYIYSLQFVYSLVWFFFLWGVGGEKGLPSKGLNRGVNNKLAGCVH